MKLVTKEIEEEFRKHPLYSQDGLGGDAEVIVKYFNPVGSGTWLITEAEKQDDGDWLLYGYCHILEWEWGYVSLRELENLKLPFNAKIERDLYTTKKYIKEYEETPYYTKENKLETKEWNMNQKLKQFGDICRDWDYRNIDMSEPHLQGIQIKDDCISISCELYSPDLEDYVSCDGGDINNKSLVEKFKQLDLDDKYEVLEFISNIEDLIDWDKVSTDLSNGVSEEKEFLGLDDTDEDIEEYIVPCKILGEGWNWHKYNDGSGHLESPDGKEYMSYDLQTNEYQETRDSRYDFFPLNYYYVDGFDPESFDPFAYMEKEMVNRVLVRENSEAKDL